MNNWKSSMVRVGHLVVPFRKELNQLGITLAILCAIDLLSIIIGGVDFVGRDGGMVWVATMFVLVTLRASSAFSELDHDPAATEWVLFPASPTEKYVAAQLRLGVLYYGLAVAAALGASALMGWIQTLVNGGIFHWLGADWFMAPSTTFLANRVTIGASSEWFLWGTICVGASAGFGKHAAWKVLLALLGAFLFWFAAMVFVHWLVFSDQMHLLLTNRDQTWRTITFLIGNWETPALDVLINQWWFGTLVPLFFVVYGWARLREFEARHALQS